MGLKQVGWSLGLTKDRRTELSDILYDIGRVSAKNHQEEEMGISPLGIATGNFALFATTENERFDISFRGQRTSFDLDDEQLFNTFNVGDPVRIAYKERYRATYDYVPPDFDRKQLVDRVPSGYEFVSAEKIK